MITKPPPGIPRSCWNIYDGKHKKKYDTLEEAKELANDKLGYQAYLCRFCDYFHIGRITKESTIQHFNRRPELEIELGTRVIAHLRMGDNIDNLKKRYRSALDVAFRIRNE